MKLVLLPGMDGTGNLFYPLLLKLADLNTTIIKLPKDGPQDYQFLATSVSKQLPKDNYLLLAESFSGPIAAEISKQEPANLKGIIFVATFLSSPAPYLSKLLSLLPTKTINKLPFCSLFYRHFFLGKKAQPELVDLFRKTINTIPSKTLNARLRSIRTLKYENFSSAVPAIYICATEDILVNNEKRKEFKKNYPNIQTYTLDGPHFILQNNPVDSAQSIRRAKDCLAGTRERESN